MERAKADAMLAARVILRVNHGVLLNSIKQTLNLVGLDASLWLFACVESSNVQFLVLQRLELPRNVVDLSFARELLKHLLA